MSIEEQAHRVLAASEREELLTVKEYAALFRCTERAVYLAIRETRLPYPIVRPLGTAALIRVPASLVASLRAA